MTKAVFACWEDRIAPVMDTAREFHVVETEPGKILRESRESLEHNQPLQVVLRMAELQPDLLVCGAISAHLQALISAYGIRVHPFTSGDLCRVIDAWMTGKLENDMFVMPGCGAGRHRRHGNGAGRGRRRRRLHFGN